MPLPSSTIVTDALSPLAAVSTQAAATGLAFYASFSSFHLLAYGLRITSYSIPGRVFGAGAIVASSVSAAWAGRWAAGLNSGPYSFSLPSSSSLRLPPLPGSYDDAAAGMDSLRKYLLSRLSENPEALRDAICGTAIFFCCGGRLRSVCPSDLRFPGAFARPKHRIPTAGEEYADQFERGVVKAVGR
jgi:hypothetical protein